MGQPLIHRTQLAASVETGFGVVVDDASDPLVFVPDFAPSGLVPFVALFAALFESLPSDVIDDEAALRLSVL
jgi:hypothetical protein